MSNYHINELQTHLEGGLWKITASDGNGYDIAGSWLLEKPDINLHLIFDGLAENTALPIKQSPACFIAEEKDIHLYFEGSEASFKASVDKFIQQLDTLH
ncbi:MAG: hypothetical protein HRU20_09125 [Pseudomonadales bacterium]|nr:hypothetical protein [Pseudomonadales bacterium]